MSLIDFIKNLFTGKGSSNLITLYLQDKKCGEQIKILLRKSYDIQRVYNDDEDAAYKINKVIICNNCYNKINIEVRFDKKYNIIHQKADNGNFISAEDYGSSEA